MKAQLLALFVCTVALSAMANPFDSFVGDYRTITKPQIIKNAKWCNRFFFKDISALRIEVSTENKFESHSVKIIIPNAWSRIPVADYEGMSENGMSGDFSVTTGSANLASNESVVWSLTPVKTRDSLIVAIENKGQKYEFRMVEASYENDVLMASCQYQVELVRK